jgi:hypothetical protein
MVAIVASVVKVTTVFGTTAPFASMSVALTVVDAPFEIEVTAVPAASESKRVSVGAATGGVPAGVSGAVVPVPVVVVAPVPELLPQPDSVDARTSAMGKSSNEGIVQVFCLIELIIKFPC